MAIKPVPDGNHTVTPCLVAQGTANLISFMEKAFGATHVEPPVKRPDGAVAHAQMQIGSSRIMLGEARRPEEVTATMLYLYVPDCDAVFKQAVAAGGTVIMEPMNMFYGDRSGGLKDAWGNQWWVATHVEDVAPAELRRRMAEEMKKRAAAEGGGS
jgi:PhnB protein